MHIFKGVIILPIISFFFSTFLYGSGHIAENIPWEPTKEKDGVKVFKKEVPGTKIVAFKGETIMEGPIEKVFHVLLDNEKRTEWVDRLEQSVVLEQSEIFDYVLYQNFFLPWPMKNREFVFRGHSHIDKVSKDIVLHMSSVPMEGHAKMPKNDAVRAELMNSYYYLTSLDNGHTKVVVEILSDPKGHIPTWAVNLIQSSWPVKTLNGIRKQLKSLDANKKYTLPDLPVK